MELERALVAARGGAEWGWARIYRELAPQVRGYLIARGAAEPDDLLGEVFLQVVRDIDSFEGTGRDFRAWVFAIAHNRLLDALRSRRRRPEDAMPDEVLDRGSWLGNVEQEAIQRLGSKEALELLRVLTPLQRDVILLRVIGGLSVPEVARVLKRGSEAIKAIQRRALRALRRELSRQGVPD